MGRREGGENRLWPVVMREWRGSGEVVISAHFKTAFAIGGGAARHMSDAHCICLNGRSQRIGRALVANTVRWGQARGVRGG